MEFNTVLSRFSSGRTTAQSTPPSVSMPTLAISPPVFDSAICLMISGRRLACPTDDGTEITLNSGSLSPSSSNVNACLNSFTLSDIKNDERFCSSRIILPDQSQQNSALPASRSLRKSTFSHSFKAFSPTNTYLVSPGKTSSRTVSSSLDARPLYTIPSYAISLDLRYSL